MSPKLLGLAAGLICGLALSSAPAQASDAPVTSISSGIISIDSDNLPARKRQRGHRYDGHEMNAPESFELSRRGRGADDPAGDDHGRRKGGRGADDKVKGYSEAPESFELSRRGRGADDPAGDDHGRRKGGRGADDRVRG